jgi:hypothetical protein
MFVSFDPDWPPPGDPPPPPRRRPVARIDRRQERRLFQAIGVNAILLLVAPIGGATVFVALARLFYQ